MTRFNCCFSYFLHVLITIVWVEWFLANVESIYQVMHFYLPTLLLFLLEIYYVQPTWILLKKWASYCFPIPRVEILLARWWECRRSFSTAGHNLDVLPKGDTNGADSWSKQGFHSVPPQHQYHRILPLSFTPGRQKTLPDGTSSRGKYNRIQSRPTRSLYLSCSSGREPGTEAL